MTYYKTINGKRYDRQLLEKAQELTQGRGDGRISTEDARQLFSATKDNGMITTTEVRTLRHILDHFPLTDKAHRWLWEKLKTQTPIQRSVSSIFHEVFQLKKIKWRIEDDHVENHTQLYDGLTSFPVALREMLDEFINGMESSTSLRDIASLELELDFDNDHTVSGKIREIMDKGTLYLFPTDYLDRIRRQEINFKYPPFTHRVKDYWPFGLRLPDLKGYYFIGFVSRKNWWDVYHTGYK